MMTNRHLFQQWPHFLLSYFLIGIFAKSKRPNLKLWIRQFWQWPLQICNLIHCHGGNRFINNLEVNPITRHNLSFDRFDLFQIVDEDYVVWISENYGYDLSGLWNHFCLLKNPRFVLLWNVVIELFHQVLHNVTKRTWIVLNMSKHSFKMVAWIWFWSPMSKGGAHLADSFFITNVDAWY